MYGCLSAQSLRPDRLLLRCLGATSQHLLTNRLRSASDQKDQLLSDYSCNYTNSHQNTKRGRCAGEGRRVTSRRDQDVNFGWFPRHAHESYGGVNLPSVGVKASWWLVQEADSSDATVAFCQFADNILRKRPVYLMHFEILELA